MINRIKQVMEYEQMSPTNFADAIDVNRSSLTHIFSGRNQPSLDVAKKILKAFPEINTEWLVMGMGTMLKTAPDVEKPVAVTNVDNMQQTDLFAETEPPIPTPELQDDFVAVVAKAPMQRQEPAEEPIMDVVEKSKPVVTPVQAQPSTTVTPRTRARNSDSHISARDSKRDRFSDSQGDKKIVKIVFFYDDRSFEEYRPN